MTYARSALRIASACCETVASPVWRLYDCNCNNIRTVLICPGVKKMAEMRTLILSTAAKAATVDYADLRRDVLNGCPWHDVKSMLRDVGLRPTRQRMALGWILFARGDRHLAPEYAAQSGRHHNQGAEPVMVTVDEFSCLVSGIYAPAVTPRQWESNIGEVRRALGGATGALVMVGDGIQASTIPIEAAESDEAYYCRLDYVLAAVAKGLVGVVRTGTEVIAPNRHTEFYTDWIHPHEFTDALPARLSGARKPPYLVVTAPRRTESFDTPERVKLMGALLPHLQQTLPTQTKLASLAQSSAGLAAALEVVKQAAIIVSSGCRVINLNAASERILRTEDGLYFRSGCIGATRMTGERQLYRAVQDALTDGSNTRGGRSFTCG